MMYSPWNESDDVGVVYVVSANPKIGAIFKPPLPVGSWYLCVEHTGDNHYQYREVKRKNKVLVLGKTFHIYGGAHPKAKWQPTNRQFHLLMAGELIDE